MHLLQGRLICTGCDEPAQQNPAYTEAVTDGAEQSNQLNLTRDQVFAQEAPQQARGGLPLVPEEDEEGVQHQGSGEMVLLLTSKRRIKTS